MRTVSLVIASVLILSACGCVAASDPSSTDSVRNPEQDPPYEIAVYDPGRNPGADLADTVARARRADKRIILEVGGEWCSWCRILDQYLKDHPEVHDALAASFVVMKVNFGPENENKAFLSDYPQIPAYPHFLVLESDGSLLHSQSTAVLEKDRSYNEDAFQAFIDQWSKG
jgi:thiol:disulfide interchange protein